MAFPPHSFMFQPDEDHHNDRHLPSLNSLLSSPPQPFLGGAPLMIKRSLSEEVRGEDELSDDGSHLGEKKKRLNLEQVKALEKSFELGNKLEPERKLQLAKALRLQPRQIAIWFQNRRARWKNKQLEKNYDALRKQFEALKADNDALQAQNEKLSAELLSLKTKDSNEISIKKENEGSSSNNGSENSCEVNLHISRTTTAITSPVNSSQLSSKHLFTSSTRPPAASMTQLLQGSSRPPDLHCLKLDQLVQEDQIFCHVFNGVDEQQQGFWPWTG